MVSRPFSSLSAVRKQHLLVEFSSLKHACPHGVFVSLTPGDPTLWSGVIFVRKGPYAPSILRFQISFPPTYPSLPPLVTFSTDMFHPLITPLTTYMYTTDIQDSGTVSATDDERLPPGGFSLRHGFPSWFGRARKKPADRITDANTSLQTPGKASGSTVGSGVDSPRSAYSSNASPTPRGTAGTMESSISAGRSKREEITTFEVLRYIRSTFDDEDVLDDVPLEAAGNPGAWHAWRTHRVKAGKINIKELAKDQKTGQIVSEDGRDTDAAPAGYQTLAGGTSGSNTTRRPGEWNWDGVWEVRVKKNVDASITESVLFGKDAGDDITRFLHLDPEQIESIKENIKRSLEMAEPQRRGVV